MKSRAKKQRQQTGRDRWTLTPQGIAATHLDDWDDDLDDWDDLDDDFDEPSGLPPVALEMAREALEISRYLPSDGEGEARRGLSAMVMGLVGSEILKIAAEIRSPVMMYGSAAGNFSFTIRCHHEAL